MFPVRMDTDTDDTCNRCKPEDFVRSAGANDETVIYGKDAKITLGTQFTPADGFSYKANGAGIVIIGNVDLKCRSMLRMPKRVIVVLFA